MKERLTQLLNELGPEENLLKLLTEFYHKLSEDILVGFFFSGKDLKEIATNQMNFMLKSGGLKKEYSGKLPASAHFNIAPILKGHFDRRIILLKELLKENGLNDEQIKTWVDFETQFRSVIELAP